MKNAISRRALLAGLSLLAAPAVAIPASGQAAPHLSAIERNARGRLGVAALDTATGAMIAHRADERFAMCSTFKFLAVTAVLARVDREAEQLSRRIPYAVKDLVSWSPVTEKYAGGPGLTLAELCSAAMTLSDNTAANLLLDAIGGPAGLTDYARSLGDGKTRLDRYEPALNKVAPGDPRDTTTPSAMMENLRRIVLGEALSASSRERITGWLLDSKTGGDRLRAGLPSTWRVGDKTGTGNGISNDIAIVWPPDRAPIIIAAYLSESDRSSRERDGILRDVGKLVAEIF